MDLLALVAVLGAALLATPEEPAPTLSARPCAPETEGGLFANPLPPSLVSRETLPVGPAGRCLPVWSLGRAELSPQLGPLSGLQILSVTLYLSAASLPP